MKTSIYCTLLVGAIASGLVYGQTTAYTTPVGYESVTVASGFNYVGLRLHRAVAFAGSFGSSTSTTLVDSNANFSSASATTLYLLELNNNKVIEVPGSFLSGTTVSGLTGITAADQGAYSIRPSATVASVFGAANSAGLAAGSFGSSGADQVWVPNGSGDFNRYYYDSFNPNTFGATWSEVAAPNNAVDPSSINLVYLDGILLVKDAGSSFSSLVVSGTVKTKATIVGLPTGFNYASSLYPVGATLASSYGATNTAGFSAGSFGSSGADQIWVPNGSGDFNRYYYDSFNPNTFGATWSEVAAPNNAVDPATVSLPSGIVIVAAASVNAAVTPPAFFSSL